MKPLELYKPDFVIECDKLHTSGSIYQILRDRYVKRSYAYGMLWKPSPIYYDFIKVGMSCPKESQIGERLVRQLAWLPGWNETPRRSDNGFAFWEGIQRYMIANKIVTPKFDKNMITIAVWDVSSRLDQFDYAGINPEQQAARWAEGNLADQYKKANKGKLPPLNHVDPSMSRAYRSPQVSKVLYTSLFDEPSLDDN